ncbi:FAD-dependent oxidoreductase [Bacillota bacterium LX-D]|nr:FAD-dependent oxidoreductase [Bacillota bacterium LX-D]
MRYLIIGNSAAGIFAAEAIRRQDPEGRIDILSDESYPAYARCMTSYYLTGKYADEKLYLRNPSYYQDNNFNLHLNEKAVEVLTEKNELKTAKGKTYKYDKLLIATGASPKLPKIPKVHSNGIFCLRTLDDAKGISRYLGPGKKAIVIGGGFVSLKAAYALLERGMSVTCIISSGQILSQMLDKGAADIVAELLTAHGLEIKYHNDVVEFLTHLDQTGADVVHGALLKSGEELAADVVVIGKGVKPNLDFLRESGIVIGEGIVTNEYMETNLDGIYAAGDVAESYDLTVGEHRINAIWPNAAEQGAIAGSNMAGQKIKYAGSMGMNSATFYDLSTIAAGQTKKDASTGFEVVQLNLGQNLYRRFVFKDDKLVGFVLVGDTGKAGVLTSYIREQLPLGDFKEELKLGKIRQKLLF